ncbi:ATP-binding protein [Geomonas sp. RF6]|uniref:sensor histidine kinase n=1 Tax=Geomonas sp. RF6 TaxID=2897342 RepID=UPI001E32F379|nr:sensor histidine kinase [Geomonas sp. RF6]UFS71932.1 ATP-binding protein [Geomonas sp. RF6]
MTRSRKFPWNFRTRLFIIFAAFTAVISATFTGIYMVRQVQSYRLHTGEKSQLLATMLAASVRLPLFSEDRVTLAQLASEYARHPGVKRVTIMNADGKVMAEAGEEPAQMMENSLSGSALVTPGLSGNSGRYLLGAGSNEKPVGRVEVVMDKKELTLLIRSMVLTSLVTALLFWVAATAVSYLVVQRITRSLTCLIGGLRALRAGDYRHRIGSVDSDEVGDAADAVNELAAALLRREEENRGLQQELINSMKREMSEERKKMMAKLIQTNRMTSLGLLVSSMAHEINTPNGAIKLAAQQLAKGWKSALPILDGVAREEGDFVLGGGIYSVVREEFLTAIEVVSRSSERIGQVIKDLRDFNAGERSELRSDVSISQVIADAMAIIRAHGRYGNIAMLNSVQPELPLVVGNRHQLEQVVINLLLNGMQAIPEGKRGQVSISAEYEKEKGMVKVAVADDGVGIDPEHLGQLIEPFFSTRIEKGGSGLGLYISNFIITEHHGSLEFDSQVGKGTTVLVRIPAKQQGVTSPSPPLTPPTI